MNKNVIKLSLSIFAFGISNILLAQDVDKKVLNWYNNGGSGMQTEKAYKKLKKRDSKTVVVAIIDSGIDIEHKDLEGKIWTNTDEIPGNGIDDDKNGYIDDVHGWNFLGNSSGENANAMRLERTRILAELSKKYDGVDASTVSASEKEEFALYEKVKSEVEEEQGYYSSLTMRIPMIIGMIDNVPSMLESSLGTKDYTEEDVEKELNRLLKDVEKSEGKVSDEDLSKKKSAADMMGFAYAVVSGELDKKGMEEQLETIQGMLDTHHNPEFDGRSVVGDDPYDFSDINYGNNDVEGPDALHGTHVGGIVGAIRGNDLGGDGVANDVLLMSLRAVPDGDEFDKDIALAIRYAVDNGASIINMSFGKGYSPNAKEVYEAFAYADSKGVLLVHAAGNDSKDIDKGNNFPTSMYDFQTKKLDHFLTIGSNTKSSKKGQLPSSFSNYGQTHVDVFAPGSEIYNAIPQSEYKVLQGTSMACPMVSGVAALLKSYFPARSMKEIKDVILSSATSYKGNMQHLPGTNDEVDFATLSVTGGVVNVKSAVKTLLKMEKAEKK